MASFAFILHHRWSTQAAWTKKEESQWKKMTGFASICYYRWSMQADWTNSSIFLNTRNKPRRYVPHPGVFD